MPRKAYARRYAQAIFEIALEQKELDRWQSDLQKVADAVGNADFLAAMESPRLKLEDKNKLLSELGDINPLVLNLVRLLITKAAIGMISGISNEYQRLMNSYYGIETAEVITAVTLDDREIRKVTEKLEAMVGKKVALKSRVDTNVIGGIVARVGGKLLDGSTRSQLAALKKELVSGERKRT